MFEHVFFTNTGRTVRPYTVMVSFAGHHARTAPECFRPAVRTREVPAEGTDYRRHGSAPHCLYGQRPRRDGHLAGTSANPGYTGLDVPSRDRFRTGLPPANPCM